jgi:subtilisin family serine protease
MARKQQCIVLRDTSATSMASPFDIGVSTAPAGAERAARVPEPKLESEDLSTNDLAKLARDRDVVSVAPVMPTRLMKPFEHPPGLSAATAWGIGAVKADVSTFNGAGVTVAVLDTGIDAGHPAFAGVSLEQQDFSGDGDGDANGHGTHCAGTIIGRDVGGQRIGVAPGVTRALIGKVLRNDGRGDSDMLFRALQWAGNEGAQVVSMSLGFDFPGLVEHLVGQGWPVAVATSAALEAYRGNLRMFDALMTMLKARAAFGSSPVVVAAAGNESERLTNPDYEVAAGLPAAADGVLSVGALAQAGAAAELVVAPFSNTLPQVSAPGVGILSAKVGGGLRALSGTSMACPHVAGVAALWWQALGTQPVPLSATAVVARVFATARTDVFGAGVDLADRGAGIVTAP